MRALPLILVAACGSKGSRAPDAGAPQLPRGDAAVAPHDRTTAFPRWVERVPADPTLPAFDVHGPVLVGDVAVVAGSAVGVVGIDLASHELLFHRRPTGRIAPPVGLDERRVLTFGDCSYPVATVDPDVVVGCYEVLDARSEAVHGSGAVVIDADHAKLGAGPTRLEVDGDRIVIARDHGALAFVLPDPPRGEVRATAAPRPDRGPARATVGDGEGRVDLWVLDDVLELRHHDPAALSDRTAMKDIAAAPGSLQVVGDEVRAFHLLLADAALEPVLIDPRSVEWSVAGAPVPGIDLLAAAHGPGGFAVAVRRDATLLHDYVAAYRTDGTVAWVWNLPPPPGQGRALPVGLAVNQDSVVVFHDGAFVAALPAP